MKAPQRIIALVVTGALLVVVAPYLDRCAPSQPTAPSAAKIDQAGDSLRIERAKLDTLLTTSALERQASADAQGALAASERRSRARADAEKRKADSLAVLAAASDSTSGQWRTAYDARTAEAAELRTELATKDARIDSLVADTTRLSRDLDRTVTYAQGLERFNADLRLALRASECRILGKVPCPSRTQVGVVGLVTGLALAR